MQGYIIKKNNYGLKFFPGLFAAYINCVDSSDTFTKDINRIQVKVKYSQ